MPIIYGISKNYTLVIVGHRQKKKEKSNLVLGPHTHTLRWLPHDTVCHHVMTFTQQSYWTGPKKNKKKNLCSSASSEDAMVQAQIEWKWKRNGETTWRHGRFPITQQARQGRKKECGVKELLNLCKLFHHKKKVNLLFFLFFLKKRRNTAYHQGEKGAEGWWRRRTVCAASSLNDKPWAAVSDVSRNRV